MNQSLTKKQFFILMKLVYLGNWIVNAFNIEQDKEYEQVEDLIFKMAQIYGFDRFSQWFKQISRELETAINSHSFYSSGHDFVADVMFYLLQKNLTVAQSLDILINNPPATVAQLRNCDEYCRNLPIPTT